MNGANELVTTSTTKTFRQGWFEFRRQLDYKLARHVSKDNRISQAKIACVACGFEENADVVGAINVLMAYPARLACEVSGVVMPPAAGNIRASQAFTLNRCRVPHRLRLGFPRYPIKL